MKYRIYCAIHQPLNRILRRWENQVAADRVALWVTWLLLPYSKQRLGIKVWEEALYQGRLRTWKEEQERQRR